MSPLLKNILAVIAGIVLGGLVNSGIIMTGSGLVPPPVGVDPMDIESIKAHAESYTAINFVVPLIAHALGTLVGAYVAVKFSDAKSIYLALIVALVFMVGGVMMTMMLPAEFLTASIVDLIVAYIPMGWLGYQLARD